MTRMRGIQTNGMENILDALSKCMVIEHKSGVDFDLERNQ